MTVEENLLMGGFIKEKTEESYQEAEIFEKYERLRIEEINLQKYCQVVKEDC